MPPTVEWELALNKQSPPGAGRSLSLLFLKLGNHLTLPRSNSGDLCSRLVSGFWPPPLNTKQWPCQAPDYSFQLKIKPHHCAPSKTHSTKTASQARCLSLPRDLFV